MMRVFAIPLALTIGTAFAEEIKCPCNYTVTQEQRTALWQALSASSFWSDALSKWLGDTTPIIISKHQQGLTDLWNALRQQEKAAVEKAANDQDKAAAEKAAKDKAEKK